MLDSLRRRPPPFIWPAVHWVVIDDQVLGALVYRGRVDVFWASQWIVRLGDEATALADGRFWRETLLELGPRAQVQSAWTGEVASTFAAGSTPSGPVADVTLRSLFPRRGEPCLAEAATRRALLEPALVLALSDRQLAFALGASRPRREPTP